jgi:alkylation response protein AidB-like acyl-CoA dehydrogenase
VSDAGYSGTPLQQKLGLKEGFTVAFAGQVPTGLADRFTGIEARARLQGPLDAVVLFVVGRAELEKRAPAAMKALGDKGMLWIAWPKKASGVPTDLTENVLRDVLLPTGWVDTKVCVIDETWSGLKFLKRLSERG